MIICSAISGGCDRSFVAPTQAQDARQIQRRLPRLPGSRSALVMGMIGKKAATSQPLTAHPTNPA